MNQESSSKQDSTPTLPVDVNQLRKLWKTLDRDDSQKPGQTYRPPSGFFKPESALTKTKASKQRPLSTAESPGKPFEFLDELGQGGMGVVYKAKQISLNREVAVKKLKQQSQLDFDSQEAFLSEAYSTALLEHPNIVPVYDLAKSDQTNMELAMKIVSGTTWDQVIKENSLVENLQILLKICDGLRFAHSRNIVHLDLKPSNVMIGAYGEVYLMDWGLALQFGEAPENDQSIRHCSQLKGPCGTPSYMAPELADGRGEDIGPWTDIYLLGATLYEIITGVPPHQGKGFFEVILAASRSKSPNFNKNTPKALIRLCRHALFHDGRQRPHSVAAFQNSVRDFIGQKESLDLSTGAEEKLESLVVKIQSSAGNKSAMLPSFSEFDKIIAEFRQSWLLWVDNESARAGEEKARQIYSHVALQAGDLNLTEAQVNRLSQGPEKSEIAGELANARRSLQRNRKVRQMLRKGLFIAVGLLLIVGVIGFFRVRRARIDSEEQREIALSNSFAAQRSKEKAEQNLKNSRLKLKGINAAFDILIQSIDVELGKFPSREIKNSREGLLEAALETMKGRLRELESDGLPYDQDALSFYIKLGKLASKRSNAKDTIEIFSKATEIAKKLCIRSQSEELQFSLAESYLGLAGGFYRSKDYQSSEKSLKSAEKILPRLATQTKHVAIEVELLHRKARISEKRGNIKIAKAHYERVTSKANGILRSNGYPVSTVSRVMWALTRLLKYTKKSGAKNYLKASQRRLDLSRIYYLNQPNLFDAFEFFELHLSQHGFVCLNKSKFQGAAKIFNERLQLCKTHYLKNKNHPYYLSFLSRSYRELAYSQTFTGEFNKAIKNYEEALKYSRAYYKTDPFDEDPLQQLTFFLHEASENLMSQGYFKKALKIAQECKELLPTLVQINSGYKDWLTRNKELIETLKGKVPYEDLFWRRVKPKSGYEHYVLACQYAEAGRHRDAVQEFKEGFQEDKFLYKMSYGIVCYQAAWNAAFAAENHPDRAKEFKKLSIQWLTMVVKRRRAVIAKIDELLKKKDLTEKKKKGYQALKVEFIAFLRDLPASRRFQSIRKEKAFQKLFPKRK